MSRPQPDFDLVFESAFQYFVEQGGLDAPCRLSEDIERLYRQQAALPQSVRCIHGLTAATCSICYLGR